jgi:superfamily II DNA helicase RecQ
MEDFDKKMAEIDKAMGISAKGNRRKRSIKDYPSSKNGKEPHKNSKIPIQPPAKERKFYDGNYALINEIPNIWKFFKGPNAWNILKGLWNKKVLIKIYDDLSTPGMNTEITTNPQDTMQSSTSKSEVLNTQSLNQLKLKKVQPLRTHQKPLHPQFK